MGLSRVCSRSAAQSTAVLLHTCTPASPLPARSSFFQGLGPAAAATATAVLPSRSASAVHPLHYAVASATSIRRAAGSPIPMGGRRRPSPSPVFLVEAMHGKEASTSSEESHILKLKKEAFAADVLWREMRDVPGGMQRWLKAREEAAKAEETWPKKRKKVVKTSLTPEFIQFLRTRPPRTFTDISDETLSRKSESFRQEYAIRKYVDGKWGEYLNALVKQYDLLGYAEDEDELTDDEDEVIKMRSLAIS